MKLKTGTKDKEMPARKDSGLAANKAANRVKTVGIRELSKLESQHRIMVAARELFAELGYERATLRQIAAKSGLTVGALFNHVTDKRDLIYLIFNEQVDKVAEMALASPRPYQGLSAKILSVTEHYMRMFGSEPELSRILLTEIVVLAPGLHLDRYLTTRAKLVNGIERMVLEAQAAGEINGHEEPEFIARQIFFVFAASLRWWLASSGRPEWRDGQRQFQRSLNLIMQGLGPAPKAMVRSRGTKTPVKGRVGAVGQSIRKGSVR